MDDVTHPCIDYSVLCAPCIFIDHMCTIIGRIIWTNGRTTHTTIKGLRRTQLAIGRNPPSPTPCAPYGHRIDIGRRYRQTLNTYTRLDGILLYYYYIIIDQYKKSIIICIISTYIMIIIVLINNNNIIIIITIRIVIIKIEYLYCRQYIDVYIDRS